MHEPTTQRRRKATRAHRLLRRGLAAVTTQSIAADLRDPGAYQDCMEGTHDAKLRSQSYGTLWNAHTVAHQFLPVFAGPAKTKQACISHCQRSCCSRLFHLSAGVGPGNRVLFPRAGQPPPSVDADKVKPRHRDAYLVAADRPAALRVQLELARFGQPTYDLAKMRAHRHPGGIPAGTFGC